MMQGSGLSVSIRGGGYIHHCWCTITWPLVVNRFLLLKSLILIWIVTVALKTCMWTSFIKTNSGKLSLFSRINCVILIISKGYLDDWNNTSGYFKCDKILRLEFKIISRIHRANYFQVVFITGRLHVVKSKWKIIKTIQEIQDYFQDIYRIIKIIVLSI